MEINRNRLMIAINRALKKQDYDTYKTLLDIYYQLLSQEDINDVYISEFISYNPIPESIYKLISQCI